MAAAECSEVFVRNLPLDLYGPELEELFSEVGPVKKGSVIHHKRQPGDGGQTSRGFGFVKFALAIDAEDSIKQLNGRTIRGRAISVELSSKTAKDDRQAAKDANKNQGKDQRAATRPAKSDPGAEKRAAAETTSSADDQPKKKQPVAAPEATETEIATRTKKRATVKATKEEIEANTQPVKVRTLRVMGLSPETTQKQLMKRVQKVATVEKVEMLPEDEAQGGEDGGQDGGQDGDDRALLAGVWPRGRQAVVVLPDVKECGKALKGLDRKLLHGATLSARFDIHVQKGERSLRAARALGGKGPSSTLAKAGRCIVRNLPFTATEEDLARALSVFGPLSEAHIPTVVMPKHFNPGETKQQSRGFGFVQFLLAQDAQKAAKEDSQVSVCGRTVKVALATAKKVFEETGRAEAEERGKKVAERAAAAEAEAAGDEDGDEDGDEGRGDQGSGREDAVEDSDGSGSSGSSESSESEEEEEKDDEDDAAIENEENKKAAKEAAKKAAVSKDVAEGRTLFVKSLPLEATEADLEYRFQDFGELGRCVVVRDASTGLSKGTGFVTFKSPESAKTAEETAKRAATGGGGFMVLGRGVQVLAAVDRATAATSFGKQGRDALKSKRDRRNLYLKDEGLVQGVGDAMRAAQGKQRHKKKKSRHGDGDEEDKGDLAATCPESDLQKRQQAHAEKKKKLTNPLFFISPMRLSVRNLAKHVDDAQLRALFGQCASEGLRLVSTGDLLAQRDAHAMENDLGKGTSDKIKAAKLVVPDPKAAAKMTACKVIRDVARPDQPSRGYGFVEFASHAHALAALRFANNNPDLSADFAAGGGRPEAKRDPSLAPRLLVEFAVENRGKLQVQEKRREVSQRKAIEHRALAAGDVSGQYAPHADPPKKQSRGQRQREKKRTQRLAEECGSGGGVAEESGGGGGVAAPALPSAEVNPMQKRQRVSEAPARKRGRGETNGGFEAEEERLVAMATEGGESTAKTTRQSRRKAKRAKSRAADPTGTAKETGPGEGGEAAVSFASMVSAYKSKLTAGEEMPGGEAGSMAKFKESSARWFE